MCKEKIKGYQSFMTTLVTPVVNVPGTTNIPYKFSHQFLNFFQSFQLSTSDPVLITRIDVFPNQTTQTANPAVNNDWQNILYWSIKMQLEHEAFFQQYIQPPLADPFNSPGAFPLDSILLNFSREKNWVEGSWVARGIFTENAYLVAEGVLPSSAGVSARIELVVGIQYEIIKR